MTNEITNSEDIIDSRDVIARIEALQAERDGWVLGAPDGTETPNPQGWANENPNDADELASLEALAKEGENYAADWHHGETLINDSYFATYCEELCKEVGSIPSDVPGYIVIDWEATAENMKVDYTPVDFDGVTYWVR